MCGEKNPEKILSCRWELGKFQMGTQNIVFPRIIAVPRLIAPPPPPTPLAIFCFFYPLPVKFKWNLI